MKFIIAVIIVIFIGLLIQSVLQKRNGMNIPSEGRLIPQKLKPMIFDTEPDLPVAFGYKSQWFAIKTDDSQAVLDELKIKNIHISNWRTGIEAAYEGYYFVSPPINGWTLVINSIMPDLSNKESPDPITVISNLSKKFGEAYYFGTHRVVGYHVWAKAVNGMLVRAYGFIGESGEVIINQGDISKEEIDNNLIFTDIVVEEPNLPNEEDVLLIAKKWTLDPLMEDAHYHIGTGFVGTLE